jgi:hypothetical protein
MTIAQEARFRGPEPLADGSARLLCEGHDPYWLGTRLPHFKPARIPARHPESTCNHECQDLSILHLVLNASIVVQARHAAAGG